MYYYDNINKDHSLILELEPSLSATKNLQECEIIFTLADVFKFSDPSLGILWKTNEFKNSNIKYVFILENTHIYEGQNLNFYKDIIRRFTNTLPGKKIFIVHTNLNFKNKHNLIYSDFYFNRTKLYFTDYNKLDLSNRLWSYYQTRKTYDLNPIPEKKSLTNVWLVLNRFDKDNIGIEDRQYFRQQFSLFCNYKNSFYGNPTENILIPGEEPDKEFLGWQPAANKYYETSLISAYVETLVHFPTNTKERNFVRCLTEKTFDPLIKGHFILPFAYPTFIDDCKQYGFQFPEFINYSYDKIINNEERFTAWKNEYLRLDSIPKFKLEHLYKINLSILHHNRNIFWKRPYDSFILRWKNAFR